MLNRGCLGSSPRSWGIWFVRSQPGAAISGIAIIRHSLITRELDRELPKIRRSRIQEFRQRHNRLNLAEAVYDSLKLDASTVFQTSLRILASSPSGTWISTAITGSMTIGQAFLTASLKAIAAADSNADSFESLSW
jgi:hypothetical protein